MKNNKLHLFIFLLIGISTNCLAQSNQVQIARNAVGKLQLSFPLKDQKSKSLSIISDGIKAINLAKSNKKTKNWSETWALKAYLHSCQALLVNGVEESDKALEQALISIDTAKLLNKDFGKNAMINAAINNTIVKKQEKGNAAFRDLDYLSAYNILKPVSDYNEKDTATAFNVAIAAQKLQYDDQFFKYLKRAKDNKMTNPGIFQSLAKIYNYKFEIENAIKILEEGITLNPSNVILQKEYINILMDNGKYDKSIAALERELSQTRTDERIFFMYGLINQYQNNISKAETAYTRALILNPNFFDAYYQMGLLYLGKAAAIGSKNSTDFKTYLTFSEKYLNSAYDIKPNDRSTASLLIEVYTKLDLTEKANQLEQRLKEF